MRVAALLCVFCVLLVTPVLAQEQTGILQGKVADASGAVLPGVTVTVAGPTVLGGAMVAVTGATGGYRIPNIPIGIYRVSFELSGFETKAHENVRIQAATTFTIDAQLGVGTVKETVTVLAEAPIIETAATDVGFTFTKDIMNTVPNSRDLWTMIAQAPGLVVSQVNVGGTQTGNQTSIRGHGVDYRQTTYVLNGANVTDNQNNGNSQFFVDVDSLEEMQIEVSSHSAEIQTPGVLLNIVPKSGTNVYHGSASLYYDGEKMSGNNVTDELRARGVDRASNLKKYYDTGGDLGGPIWADKIWFWGAFRWQQVEKYNTGTKLPDGTFPVEKTQLWYPSAKLNWLVTKRHNFSTYFNMAQKKVQNRNMSLTRPLETAQTQQGNPIARLFTFRDDWTATSKLLVSIKVNVMDQGYEIRARPEIDVKNTPASQDLATGMWSGAPPSEYGGAKSLRGAGGTANWYVDNFLRGQHDLKLGFEMAKFRVRGNQAGSVALTTYPADHRLQFFNGQPLQVMLFAAGAQDVAEPTRSAFIQDSWRSGRLTLNVGTRWDWQTNYLNEVTGPASRYLTTTVHQEKTGHLMTWNTLAPRLGVVYDVTGNSKNLFKASYARYYWQLWTDRAAQASVAADRSYTYVWNDLNGDRKFQNPGELGALLAVDDPATRPVRIDPNLKPTKTDELTGSFTRELMANVSLSASLMWRKDTDIDWRINQSISPADYAVVTGTDPGRDGVRGTADDGQPLTFYEIAAAKRTLSPNFVTTRTGFSQEYKGFEVTVHRRMADRWQLIGSFTTGKDYENYLTGAYQNPQDIDKMDGRRTETSVPWMAKLMGSYMLPKNIMVSGSYQAMTGTPFTRTVNSASALGRSLNQGNVAIFAEPRSSQHYPTQHILDLRGGYDIKFGKRTVSLALDAFNILNVNTVRRQQVLSGPLYGRVSDFIAPRIVRVGAKFRF